MDISSLLKYFSTLFFESSLKACFTVQFKQNLGFAFSRIWRNSDGREKVSKSADLWRMKTENFDNIHKNGPFCKICKTDKKIKWQQRESKRRSTEFQPVSTYFQLISDLLPTCFWLFSEFPVLTTKSYWKAKESWREILLPQNNTRQKRPPNKKFYQSNGIEKAAPDF